MTNDKTFRLGWTRRDGFCDTDLLEQGGKKVQYGQRSPRGHIKEAEHHVAVLLDDAKRYNHLTDEILDIFFFLLPDEVAVLRRFLAKIQRTKERNVTPPAKTKSADGVPS